MMLFENVSNLAADTCPAFDDDFLLHPNAKRRAPFDAASTAFVRHNPRQCLCYAFSCTELQRCQSRVQAAFCQQRFMPARGENRGRKNCMITKRDTLRVCRQLISLDQWRDA